MGSIAKRASWLTAYGLAALLTAASTWAEPPPAYADVAPIFRKYCTGCHSGKSARRGLRLDTYAGIKRGSVDGPVLVTGEPGASELVRRIRGESLPRMPLTGPPFLEDAEIARIEAWIAAGVPRRTVSAPAPPPAPTAHEPHPVQEPLAAQAVPRPVGSAVTYADVASIFQGRCVVCHSGGTPPRGLRLDTLENIKKGSERGPGAVAGDPDGSELILRLRGIRQPRMPLTGPPFLGDEEIALVASWIEGGLQEGAEGTEFQSRGAEDEGEGSHEGGRHRGRRRGGRDRDD